MVNELPAGKGFADCVFIPYKPDIPALIIELKKDDSVENAIEQIKNRKYPEALEKYKDIGVPFARRKSCVSSHSSHKFSNMLRLSVKVIASSKPCGGL